jgi:hypothetical protein
LFHSKNDYNLNLGIGKFFFAGNVVGGEHDYGLAEVFVSDVRNPQYNKNM